MEDGRTVGSDEEMKGKKRKEGRRREKVIFTSSAERGVRGNRGGPSSGYGSPLRRRKAGGGVPIIRSSRHPVVPSSKFIISGVLTFTYNHGNM